MIVHERALKDVLTPAYHWLFIIIARLQHGVKFLVDLRTDVLVNKIKKSSPNIMSLATPRIDPNFFIK